MIFIDSVYRYKKFVYAIFVLILLVYKLFNFIHKYIRNWTFDVLNSYYVALKEVLIKNFTTFYRFKLMCLVFKYIIHFRISTNLFIRYKNVIYLILTSNLVGFVHNFYFLTLFCLKNKKYTKLNKKTCNLTFFKAL